MSESPCEIGEFLKKHGLETLLPVFQEHAVDFEVLLLLNEADLKEIAIPLGPRKRLINALENSRKAPSFSQSTDPASGRNLQAAEEELRQITALFCDMVGFTELAGKLDVETLADVIADYEERCRSCIQQHGGHVLHCLGDGIVAIFGFPNSGEDDASRAVETGLALVEEMSQIQIPRVGRLRARVGIDSGVVMVTPRENRAIGDALNIAARLQAEAEPNHVMVSELVTQLTRFRFEYESRGPRTLKGVNRPIHAFQVVRSLSLSQRFEVSFRNDLLPMLGRQAEVDRLAGLWENARAGRGSLSVVIGEPGIGKSRMVADLYYRAKKEDTRGLLFQCAPQHAYSAFFPLIETIERFLNWEPGQTPCERLRNFVDILSGRYGLGDVDVALLGKFFDMAVEDRLPTPQLSAQRQKIESVAAFARLLVAMSAECPLMVLFEDVHWVDPSTLEVLALLPKQLASSRLLLVVTARPEFEVPWENAEILRLHGISAEAAEVLIQRLTGTVSFCPKLTQRVLERTDGIPLFIEELTKSILESHRSDGTPARELSIDDSRVEIPGSLRELLMARLDRSEEMKRVAQIGAVIGREFPKALAESVFKLRGWDPEPGFRRLLQSGLASTKGSGQSMVFVFNHALIQDAAYESILKKNRRAWHLAVAESIESGFAEIVNAEPERLAEHFAKADKPLRAIPFWLRAGEIAFHRFAHREARYHLEAGLRAIELSPPGKERDLLELRLRSALAPAIVATSGWVAPELEPLLEPAIALARTYQDRSSMVPAFHILWIHSQTGGLLRKSEEWAAEMIQTGKAIAHDDLSICGNRSMMSTTFWLGDMLRARVHGERVRSAYDSEKHGHICKSTMSDPLVGYGNFASQYLWILGYPDQALEVCIQNHQHALRLAHPFDRGLALTLGAQTLGFRGDAATQIACAQEAQRLGIEHGIPTMSDVLPSVSLGVALLRLGRFEESRDQLCEGLQRIVASGQNVWVSYIRSLYAQALAETGAPEHGMQQILTSIETCHRQEEFSHFAEILRIKALIHRKQNEPEQARVCLEEGLNLARQQSAKAWELRIAMDLARMHLSQNDVTGADNILHPVYQWFEEGLDTQDLTEARALLELLDGRSSTGSTGSLFR